MEGNTYIVPVVESVGAENAREARHKARAREQSMATKDVEIDLLKGIEYDGM